MAELQTANAQLTDKIAELEDAMAATQEWAESEESENERLRAQVKQFETLINCSVTKVNGNPYPCSSGYDVGFTR